MEIDITEFFNNAECSDYSASVIEKGENAGKITWQSSIDGSNTYMMIDTDEKREAFREHVKGFGAWDDTEIASWSDIELNALFIQLVAGDIREAEALEWNTENHGGRVCRPCDSVDGRAYYYIGD